MPFRYFRAPPLALAFLGGEQMTCIYCLFMDINYHKYPQPRIRHHNNPQFYIPYNELLVKPRSYPPVIEQIDWQQLFANGQAPSALDIGCGMGKFLIDYAELHPHTNILGLETRAQAVHWINGVIEGEKVANGRALWYSVVNGLDFIPDASIHSVMYFFPDPWFKKRHAKRRAFSPTLLDGIARILQPGGTLYLMTDVPEVDEYQCEVLEAHGRFRHRLVAEGEEWFSIRTDQEITCLRNNIPFVRRVCSLIA